MSITNGTCRHCKRPARIFARCLCRSCYLDLDIRRQYPRANGRGYKVLTAKEFAELRRLILAGHSHARTAAALGMTAKSVSRAVSYYGLAVPRRPWTKADDRKLLRLHAAGLGTRAICRRMGRSASRVKVHMGRLGLSAPGLTEDVRRQLSVRAKKMGLGAIGREHHRVKAAGLGWPQANSAGQARVLEALSDAGGVGSRELAVRIGCHRRVLVFRLMRLMRLGLVRRTGTVGRGVVYDLAPGVRRHVPSREVGEGPLPKCPQKLLAEIV